MFGRIIFNNEGPHPNRAYVLRLRGKCFQLETVFALEGLKNVIDLNRQVALKRLH